MPQALSMMTVNGLCILSAAMQMNLVLSVTKARKPKKPARDVIERQILAAWNALEAVGTLSRLLAHSPPPDRVGTHFYLVFIFVLNVEALLLAF